MTENSQGRFTLRTCVYCYPVKLIDAKMRQRTKSIIRKLCVCKWLKMKHFLIHHHLIYLTVQVDRSGGGVAENASAWAITPKGENTAYIALFKCAVKRTICLEIMEDFSCASVLKTYRRFCTSCPNLSLSDSATSSVAASSHSERLKDTPHVRDFLLGVGWQWECMSVHAPWIGATSERCNGTVKMRMKVLTRALVSYHEFNTLIVELEAVVTDRQLN